MRAFRLRTIGGLAGVMISASVLSAPTVSAMDVSKVTLTASGCVLTATLRWQHFAANMVMFNFYKNGVFIGGGGGGASNGPPLQSPQSMQANLNSSSTPNTFTVTTTLQNDGTVVSTATSKGLTLNCG